jgi:hypothetical protein
MKNCTEFEGIFQSLSDDANAEIPDTMALHLDECHLCRRRFDEGKVELYPEVFESLSSRRRERMLNAIRCAGAKRRRGTLA